MMFILINVFLSFMPCYSWDFSQSRLQKYCKISCSGNRSVMCRRILERCQLASSCANSTKAFYITMEERHLITHMHNRLRNQVALGLYNDLIATDMMEILWNDELEDLAVCWANACQVKPDTCIKTLVNETVGQNIALLNETHLSRGRIVALQVGIQMWFKEISETFLGADEIDSYDENKMRFSKNFTQAIWANTRFIGCGRVFFGESKDEKSLLVCNYLPAGNVPGEKVYTRGEKPCSQCFGIDEDETDCNTKVWTALCRSPYFESMSFDKSSGSALSIFSMTFATYIIVVNLLC